MTRAERKILTAATAAAAINGKSVAWNVRVLARADAKRRTA
jgi:hypothetical protein